MILALAACAAGSFAFATTAAEASTIGLGLAPTQGKVAPSVVKPKIYELCLEVLGACSPLEVYKKTHTWNAPDICWTDGECIAPFDGTFVKGVKGEVSYYAYGPEGEEDAGEIIVVKVKKSKPARYFGSFYIFGGFDGTAEVIT